MTFNIRYRLYLKREKDRLQKLIDQKPKTPRIYFFSTPVHSNLVDQAQLMCWLRLFKEWYPSHDIICIPALYRQFETLRKIREIINRDTDKIFIHSGYLIFDPHPELPFILDVIRAFYDFPITILPQTVNLVGEWYQQVVARQFNSHSNLTLACRDEVSLGKAKVLFPNVKLKLMPDVVTSLIGNNDCQYYKIKGDGVMLCVRNDGEKLYTNEQIKALKNRYNNIRTTIIDTSIEAKIWEWASNRENLINRILNTMSKYQVIITDRYHGTIFSQIVDTPVIVISSTDHKLSSGVKWFPKERFEGNIMYANNLDEAYNYSLAVLERKGIKIQNSAWLKSIITQSL